MRKTECESKKTKNRSRSTKRLCALILLMVLFLSLLPTAFAEGKGKLSVTPTVIINDETCRAKLLRAASPEETRELLERWRAADDFVEGLYVSPDTPFWLGCTLFGDAAEQITYNDWEIYIFELSCFEGYMAFQTESIHVNGKTIQAYLYCEVSEGETANGYLMVNTTLLGLAGIDRIKTLEFSLAYYDYYENHYNWEIRDNPPHSEWVSVPVSDTRTAPYPVGGERVSIYDRDSLQLTVLGLDDITPPSTLNEAVYVFFEVRNDTERFLEEIGPEKIFLNGEQEWGIHGYMKNLEPKTLGYFMCEVLFREGPLKTFSAEFYLNDANSEAPTEYEEIAEVDVSACQIERPVDVFARYSEVRLLSALCATTYISFHDMEDMEFPRDNERFDVTERMTVGKTGNGDLLILPKPDADANDIGSIAAGTEVTVIAESKGYYFFVDDDGRMGWNSKDYFTETDGASPARTGRTSVGGTNAAPGDGYGSYTSDEL